MRWEPDIGRSYSAWWDDATKSAGKRNGVRPYRSPSTRLLRTGEEKQHEKWTNAFIPSPSTRGGDGSTANMQHTHLHRPVSLSWQHRVSYRELPGPFRPRSQHHVWTETSAMSFSTVSVSKLLMQSHTHTHTHTKPMQHTCTTASLTGQGAKRERRSSIWTVFLQTQQQKLRSGAGTVALRCEVKTVWWETPCTAFGTLKPDCCHTEVVVLGDSCSSSGARSLLSEVVSKFDDAGVFFQHFRYLHLYSGAQLLPLN